MFLLPQAKLNLDGFFICLLLLDSFHYIVLQLIRFLQMEFLTDMNFTSNELIYETYMKSVHVNIVKII